MFSLFPCKTTYLKDQDLAMMLPSKEFVYPAAASVSALIAAGFDLKSRRIPNFITGPAILAGLLLHTFYDGWHGTLSSLAAGLICGIIFLVFYLAGGMGAGDVKLITAVGCLVGLTNSASVLVITALAGGLMAIGFALMRGQLKATLFNVAALATHHKQQGLTPHPDINVRNASTLRLPYGLAIAAGSCITLYLQGMQR
jgi:prepilin peptidase CpaA